MKLEVKWDAPQQWKLVEVDDSIRAIYELSSFPGKEAPPLPKIRVRRERVLGRMRESTAPAGSWRGLEKDGGITWSGEYTHLTTNHDESVEVIIEMLKDPTDPRIPHVLRKRAYIMLISRRSSAQAALTLLLSMAISLGFLAWTFFPHTPAFRADLIGAGSFIAFVTAFVVPLLGELFRFHWRRGLPFFGIGILLRRTRAVALAMIFGSLLLSMLASRMLVTVVNQTDGEAIITTSMQSLTPRRLPLGTQGRVTVFRSNLPPKLNESASEWVNSGGAWLSVVPYEEDPGALLAGLGVIFKPETLAIRCRAPKWTFGGAFAIRNGPTLTLPIGSDCSPALSEMTVELLPQNGMARHEVLVSTRWMGPAALEHMLALSYRRAPAGPTVRVRTVAPHTDLRRVIAFVEAEGDTTLVTTHTWDQRAFELELSDGLSDRPFGKLKYSRGAAPLVGAPPLVLRRFDLEGPEFLRSGVKAAHVRAGDAWNVEFEQDENATEGGLWLLTPAPEHAGPVGVRLFLAGGSARDAEIDLQAARISVRATVCYVDGRDNPIRAPASTAGCEYVSEPVRRQFNAAFNRSCEVLRRCY